MFRGKHTSAQAGECCLGDKKNVPSTNGYLSKTSMAARQRTHVTRDHCRAANVDRMKHLVSSLPWLPSSSIWKQIVNEHIIILCAQSCWIYKHIIQYIKIKETVRTSKKELNLFFSTIYEENQRNVKEKNEFFFQTYYKFIFEDPMGNVPR